MNNTPFFSIIIPTYNRAHILINTLQSVKSQTFTDWECIVVDDGSNDATKEMMAIECKDDIRIHYIYQNNAERSAARNKGINSAKGTYICFLDSDDAYKDNHLQVLYNSIQSNNNPTALFFTNFDVLKEGTVSAINIPKLSNDAINYFFTNAIIPARVCISKEIVKKKQFDEDIVIVEDTILWARIARHFKIIHIEESTVVYNLHEDNSINIKNNSFQKRLAGLKLFFKRYPDIAANLKNDIKKSLLGDAYFGIARHYIYKNHKQKALKNILISIRYQKFHPQLKHKLFIIYKLVAGSKIDEYSG